MSRNNGNRPKRIVDETDVELGADADLNEKAKQAGMHPTPRERVTIEEAVKAHHDSQRDKYLP